ncbi:hypothetical protein ACLOJK_007695 [Asimina triloba]
MLCSIPAEKNDSTWLDRLRASKGFPTQNGLETATREIDDDDGRGQLAGKRSDIALRFRRWKWESGRRGGEWGEFARGEREGRGGLRGREGVCAGERGGLLIQTSGSDLFSKEWTLEITGRRMCKIGSRYIYVAFITVKRVHIAPP